MPAASRADELEDFRAAAAQDGSVTVGPVRQHLGPRPQFHVQPPAALQISVGEHAAQDLAAVATGAIDDHADERAARVRTNPGAMSQNALIMTQDEATGKDRSDILLTVDLRSRAAVWTGSFPPAPECRT